MDEINGIRFYHWSKYVLFTMCLAVVILFSIAMMQILIGVQSTSDRLLSCTDPKGECYQSGDRRSGAAIKTINDYQKRIVITAAYCAKQAENKTTEQIEKCVNEEIAK
jgi:hypothetical protein